jgi:hypothetical protein
MDWGDFTAKAARFPALPLFFRQPSARLCSNDKELVA